MSTTKTPAGVSIADAAEQKQCSTKTIRRLIASGELPAYRVGKRLIRIRQADLDALDKPIACAQVG